MKLIDLKACPLCGSECKRSIVPNGHVGALVSFSCWTRIIATGRPGAFDVLESTECDKRVLYNAMKKATEILEGLEQ